MLRFCTSLLLLAIATAGHAADSRLGDGCDLQEIGLSDKQTFLRFDRDFRFALAHGDAAATALLAQFPLRISFADGSHVPMSDPATLQKQFARVFTPALREAVRKQTMDDFFCKYTDGIAYANGGVWVNLAGAVGEQLRVVAVNVPDESLTEAKAGAIDLACSTKQFRIVIDATGKESTWRYRVWNLPRSVHDKPDLELTGARDIEGTSPCTHRIWRFRNANAEYELAEPGCGQDPPPKNAAAQLTVSIDGQTKLESWCF